MLDLSSLKGLDEYESKSIHPETERIVYVVRKNNYETII